MKTFAVLQALLKNIRYVLMKISSASARLNEDFEIEVTQNCNIGIYRNLPLSVSTRTSSQCFWVNYWIHFFCSLEPFLLWLTVWKDRLKMYLPKNVFHAQRVQVKLLPRLEKCYFHLPLELFWLTMMSQIESTISTQYTLLYENEQFESQISQWRLLLYSWLGTKMLYIKGWVVFNWIGFTILRLR